MIKKRFIIIGILILIELTLRYGFGFCDALLYIDSKNYEYIASPNQDRNRFGARIIINSYSQRSDEPQKNKIKILGLGDSVLFGGTWMDHDSLASTIFSLDTKMQMLNISAGSWGPDNCAAYLKENGIFNAKAMILVCSSHDAYDTMSFQPVVGQYPNYPIHQYPFAIQELIDRYAIPYLKKLYKKKIQFDPDEAVVRNNTKELYIPAKSIKFNPGFNQLKKISETKQIPFAIYLHAEKAEIIKGKYNSMGEKIIEWATRNKVFLIKGLDEGEALNMYKDKIHYNESGQKFLAKELEHITNYILKEWK